MNKNFIAYFDYLGYKSFIENNDLKEQARIMGNIFRDIENALGKGKLKDAPHGVIADLSNSKINCINFSDTIVFWTNDDSESSMFELLEVAYRFNWQCIDYFFPVRGSIVYDEIIHIGHKQESEAGGMYNINSVFGKGIVRAHGKAEYQNWAGSVMDNTFIEILLERGYDVDKILAPYAKKHMIPYKGGIKADYEEYALRLVNGNLNSKTLKNVSDGIRNNFGAYNKSVNNDSVQQKVENTLDFLKTFYDPSLDME